MNSKDKIKYNKNLSDEQIETELLNCLDIVNEHNVYSIQEVVNISNLTLYNYRNNEAKYKDITDEIVSILITRINEAAMSNQINITMARFRLEQLENRVDSIEVKSVDDVPIIKFYSTKNKEDE